MMYGLIVTATIIVIIGFLVILLLQHQKLRARSAQIQLLSERLQQIITEQTSEKLLLFTDDRDLIPLLIEINRLLESNQQASAEYMRMEQSMRRMLSNISHDLKTPLTVVLGYIETMSLNSDLPNEERMQLLSKVHAKTDEVIQLVRRFFDLARLESEDKQVPLSRIHMNEVCSRNILAFYDTLSNKGFEVVIDIPDKQVLAWANEEAMDRILNNLIGNAIRHGGDGKKLGLTLRSDNEFVYVDIWDTGKGIDAKHHDIIFERMYTLDESRNQSFEGSGLGLTITKRLMEAQGGTITVRSIPYVNTTFTVKLKQTGYYSA